MTDHQLLFVVFPFVAFGLFLFATILRWRFAEFTVSSMSSQLLESRRLFWGSISFHWGISLILLGHLLALLIPRGFEIWNGVRFQTLLLEVTGLALGIWTLFGLLMLIARRLQVPRIRAVTTPMDSAVLAVLLVQIITGLWIAVGYRWGSFWGTAVFVPYVRSLLTLSPRPELLEALPWVLKTHVLSAFALMALFPFSRLVHIITLPLGYLTRPGQRTIRTAPEDRPLHPVGDDLART